MEDKSVRRMNCTEAENVKEQLSQNEAFHTLPSISPTLELATSQSIPSH